MTPERWRQIKQVFAAALEVEPPARGAAVDACCGGDNGLRDEVRSLLAAHGSLSATGLFEHDPRPLPEPAFTGDARFSVESRLGAGGFGVVYRALDRTRGRPVALKVLREPDGLGLVRFKREFRALADLTHPHLVRLDELFASGSPVFFTMELVLGRPLVEALEGARVAGDWNSVARAFAGLVEGVRALHAAGLLHRDLKPSNVLLTQAGRVVILDFGLAASLRSADGDPAVPLAGTPAYMAPEQFVSRASSEASDLYAVGVMLYEAIAGRLPFEAGPDQLLALIEAKATRPARLPAAAAAVPSALAGLCERLLQADAGGRPSSAETHAILRTLTGQGVATPLSATLGSGPVPFVGREIELAALRAAWARARAGQLAVVCLRGASGMGKTALARRYLDEIEATGGALVLEGRCHEREALAFKALDGVVDGLRQLFESLPRDDVAALRPDGVEELERLFPVLRFGRTASIADGPAPVGDDGEQRRRGFAALRELLVRVATSRAVVIFIDDLHWGDDDSAALLRVLLRPAGAPPLLLIAAGRRDIEVAPAFANLLDALAASGCREDVAVEPLADDEASALTSALLGDRHVAIEAVTAEAGGVPFFVDTLVEEVRERALARDTPSADPPIVDADGSNQDLRLRTAIGARVQRLPAPARRLLEAVALAGKPVPRAVAEAAAQLEREDDGDFERLLRARRLVRLGGDGASLETFHDRVRDGVIAAVPAEARVTLHGRLARALAADGRADPEDLAHHLAAAGERSAAAEQAVLAADRRSQMLAFDRAAALYATAIELRGSDHPDSAALAARRAEALAAAGHGTAAGAAFLAAAERLPVERAALTCRGAEQLMRSGDVAHGRRVMEKLLRGLGWRVPRTAVGALLAVALRRATLAIRGLRAPHAVWSPGPRTPENLLRMDASWALASSAMMLDTVRATYYQTHNLRLAFEEGEPFRLARALGLEAISASLSGGRSPAGADQVLDLLRAVTTRAGHPIMNGLAPLSEGVVAANRGQWRRARDRSRLAMELLAAHGAGVAWELSTARSFLLGALVSMGQFREYAVLLPRFLEEPRARGDLYAEAVLVLSACSYIVPLKDDRIADAEAEVDGALARLAGPGFHFPKLWGLFAKVDIALYAGDAEKAWRLLSRPWPVSRSLLLFVQTIRVHLRHLRGRAALAMASHPRDVRARRRFLAIAAREARALEREQVPWSSALALTLRAGLARLRGDVEVERTLLREAALALGAVDMVMHAAGIRHALGRLQGGAEGAILVRDAEAWMRSEDVRRPDRVAATLYPGPPLG